jgi:hypothetical protein
MKLTQSMFRLLGIAMLCVTTPGLAEPRSSRDQDTGLSWNDTCPKTLEEIAKLKQCVQCPREDDDYVTKVCCPPNDRFTGAKGGCVTTNIEVTCRLIKPEADRKSCYEKFLLPGVTTPGSNSTPGGLGLNPPSSGFVPPPVDPSFDTCMNKCQEIQRYTPFLDVIGCRYACGPNSKNPGNNNYQTGGCVGLRRYCYSLRSPPAFGACQNLYRELCY